MTDTPRVAIALPAYNGADHLREALESLLIQSYQDFALVVVDDVSADETHAIAQQYAALDPRLTVRRNATRLGLTRNWRRAFEVAVGLHPEAQFFAWTSDHDVWHPRWLEALVSGLDTHPDAVMAFPDSAHIDPGGGLIRRPPSSDTTGVRDMGATFDLLATRARAGHMIYGLFRTPAVRTAGGFRHVLYADRLLLAEVAMQGALVRVPRLLWYRRPTGAFGVARQRRACFPQGAPPHAYLPWQAVHAGVIWWSLLANGASRPGPAAAASVAAHYLVHNSRAAAIGRWRIWRRRLRRRRRTLRERLTRR